MTAAVGLACLIVGLFVSLLVIRRSRSRWVLAGQRQAELAHEGWHPLLVEGWNQTEPRLRRRSPDRQLSPAPMDPRSRPAMYRP